MSPRELAPRCLYCLKKPARVLHRGDRKTLAVYDARFFCSFRCAARWATIHASSNDSWCGVFDTTDGVISVHGWHRESACPKCS